METGNGDPRRRRGRLHADELEPPVDVVLDGGGDEEPLDERRLRLVTRGMALGCATLVWGLLLWLMPVLTSAVCGEPPPPYTPNPAVFENTRALLTLVVNVGYAVSALVIVISYFM